MSDQSGGPGWWLASDGRWYPPGGQFGPEPSVQPAAGPSEARGRGLQGDRPTPLPGPQEPGASPGLLPPRDPAQTADRRAVGGAAASGVGLLLCPIVGSIAGLGLGLSTRKEATKRWAPLTAIVLGVVGLLIWIPALAFAAANPKAKAKSSSPGTTTITIAPLLDIPTTTAAVIPPPVTEAPTTAPSTVVVTTQPPPTTAYRPPATTPTTAYVPPTRASVPSTAPAVVQGVTAGAFCSPAGARGRTDSGTAMVCTTTATDSRNRWRAA